MAGKELNNASGTVITLRLMRKIDLSMILMINKESLTLKYFI